MCQQRLGAHFINGVKTGYTRYPKKYIESKMRYWSSGMHIVLQSKEINGEVVIAMGYK